MSQILRYLVSFLMVLFFVSCNNEEIAENKENTNLNQVKNNLELDKFSNVNIAENVAVGWETIKETQKGNFKISEISVHEKTASTLESNFLENHLKYQIVTIESEGQLYSYFIEVYTSKGSNVYPETITKLNDFTGTLNVFHLNGENLGLIAIYNGKARDISENNNLNILEDSINNFLTKSDAANKMPQCGGNYTVTIDQTLSRFDVWSVGDKIIAINYVGTTTTRTTSIMPFPCDGNYSKEDIMNQRLELYNYKNGSGGGSGTVATIITDASFSNNPCLLGVFNKLGGSLIFQKYLKQFNSEFSVANLKLASGNKGLEGITAQTSPPVNSEIVITFNDTRLNRPALDIARTFIHEIIHAEMFRQLLNLAKKDGSIDANELTRIAILPNSNELLEYYGYYTECPQHELMAIRYRETIISFLKEVDKNLTQKQYEAIAWQGLQGTDSWNKMTANEMADIQNTYEGWKNVTPNSCN